MSPRDDASDKTGSLFRMLQDKLELERKFGVEAIAAGEAEVASSSVPSPLEGEGQGEGATDEAPALAENLSPTEKADALAALNEEMSDCHKCPLGDSRTNLVFGVGNANAELMFVGEAPGADEDAQGEPFVGRAGKLLDKIIGAMGLKRSEVYIANILKCRPPGNRNPQPAEVVECIRYLLRQIDIIQPKVLVCLGGIAATTLLQTDLAVGKLRGRFHDFHGTPLLVTYHPAYLLRNSAGKAPVWEDMKTVLAKMGLPVPE